MNSNIKIIANKLNKKQALTDKELEVVLAVFGEQVSCIEYYLQNFTGMWDCDKVNVNWRAKKYIKLIEEIKNVR